MLDEFKKFIMRGNVIDLAVGIIIGGAFGTIVQSLVNDIIMPPIGLILGGVDFGFLAANGRAGTDTIMGTGLIPGTTPTSITNFEVIVP